MLDRTTYPSVDALAADVEAASGFRVQILIDDLKDGFAVVHRPADDNPQTLIRVAARFADHAHAIAAVYLASQLRSYRPGNAVRAALKQDVVEWWWRGTGGAYRPISCQGSRGSSTTASAGS